MNISIIQLEYIVALEKHRHFVRAAQACFVTQPTLSMQIKKLEDEFGLKLFDRSKQPIMPTDIGKKIIAQAREVLHEAQRIENIVDEFKDTVSGELHIGILPTISQYLMPLLISKMGRKYPDLKLYVKELITEDIIKMLKEDHIDIGILSTPLYNDSIIEDPVFYEKFLLYLNPGHPAFKKDVLSIEDLKKDRIWLLSEGNCFRNQIVNICSLQTDQRASNLDYESGSIDTLKRLVDIEGGLTVLPEWAALELSDKSRSKLRSLEKDQSVREVSLVYSRNYAKVRSVKVLKEMIAESLPDSIKGNEPVSIVATSVK